MSTVGMPKIEINYEDALSIAESVNTSCGDLANLSTFSVPEGASTFGGSSYFSDMQTFVDELTTKGEDNCTAVGDYVTTLQALNGETAEIETPDKDTKEGNPGGHAPVGGGAAGLSGKTGNPEDKEYQKAVDARNKAKKLNKSGKMSDKSYDKTVKVFNAAAAMAAAGQLSRKTYEKTIDATDHAMDLLDAGKMKDDTYYKTLDTIDKGLSLVKAKKLSDSSYAKAVETLDHAMDALEAGKMSEETYNKVVDTISHAMDQVKAGKMSDADFKKTVEAVDNCTKQLQSGKMSEDTYSQTVGTVDSATQALGSGKMSDTEYRQTISAIDGATDLLGAGKLDEKSYSSMIGTIDGAIKDLAAGKMSPNTYESTINGLNYALSRLNSGKITADDYRNAVNAINQAYADFKAGKIDEATYNRLLQETTRKLNGYSTPGTTSQPANPVLPPSTGPGSEEVQPKAVVPNEPDSSKTVEGSSIAGSLAGGVVSSTGANSLTGGAGSIGGTVSGATGNGSGSDNPVMKVIDQGASQLVSSVLPFSNNSGGSTSSVGQNNASAGIIAAASLVAGGAAAGGGIFIGKKISVIRFTPEDWMDLGEEYQKVITSLMKKVGFSDADIETFTNSKFKIATRELNEHISKIEKAIATNPLCEEDLMNLYGFSMFDENSKVVDYLLFIVMIIDGINAIDDYNIYNIINQGIEDIDDADFIYSGISMENYFDDSNEDDEEIKIMNDPIGSPDTELEEAVSPSMGKDWLRDMGVDAY